METDSGGSREAGLVLSMGRTLFSAAFDLEVHNCLSYQLLVLGSQP
jgi:hypothetical protein